jgi:hypothetical protein
MALVQARSTTIDAVVSRLQDQVSAFDLVKAFDGHPGFLRDPDAYSLACNGRFPSALVLSEGRDFLDGTRQHSLIFGHTISVYVATQDYRGADGRETPLINDILDDVIEALHDYSPGGIGGVRFVFRRDERLARSDFLTIYRSSWETAERGR